MTSPTPSTEPVLREAAWQRALMLYRQWEDAEMSARGGVGGGYRAPGSGDRVRRLRTELDELIHKHNFLWTRVDPLLSWHARQSEPWTCPPLDRPGCSHNSDTCEVHTGRRERGLSNVDCGDRRGW